MKKKKIVIIGAGFAGAYLAKKFKREKDFKVYLIDKRDHFLFTPLLVEVASASLSASSVIEFLPQVLGSKNINFIKDEVLDIDFNQSLLTLTSQEINYDYLVLATGSKANYGIKGSREFSLPLKEMSDAIVIKEKIVNFLFSKQYLSVSVVGSGATGIELISDLAKLVSEFNKYTKTKKNVKLTLIGSRERILTDWPKSLQNKAMKRLKALNIDLKLGFKVKEIKEREILLENNESIKSDLTILSSGVIANVIKNIENKISLNQRADILVNKYLQINNYSHVFAFGDVASSDKLAQTASLQANTAFVNIKNLNSGKKLVVYKHKLKGKLISLGKFYAIGEVYGIKVSGLLAWFIWRTVYLFKFISWRKKIQVAIGWTINLFSPRDLSTWKKE